MSKMRRQSSTKFPTQSPQRKYSPLPRSTFPRQGISLLKARKRKRDKGRKKGDNRKNENEEMEKMVKDRVGSVEAQSAKKAKISPDEDIARVGATTAFHWPLTDYQFY